MPTYKKCPIEVRTIANAILTEFESHAPLIEAKVNVDLIFAYCDRDDETNEPLNEAIMHQGVKAYGLSRILGLKDRVMGRGDAEIILDADWWHGTASEEMQRALLDHELHHLALKIVKGQVMYDVHGRPKLRLRKHDIQVGWFTCIAARHGKHSIEQLQAKTIMDAFGQFFWPELAPAPETKQVASGKKK
jgi:hypothetical protein